MSPPIGEAFARDAAHNGIGTLLVAEAERHAIVVAEIEFAKVSLQMLLAHVMVDTIDPALEDREVALDRIGVGIATDVFADGVNDRLMTGEFLADLPIDAALVCPEMRVFGARIASRMRIVINHAVL